MHFRNILLFIVLLALPISVLGIGIDLDERESRFNNRLCERVVKRFSENDRMWNRVLNRIQNRFGFSCSRPQDAISITDIVATSATTIEVELSKKIPIQTQLDPSKFYLETTMWVNGAEKPSQKPNALSIDLLHRPEETKTDLLEIVFTTPMQPGNEATLHIEEIQIGNLRIENSSISMRQTYTPICLGCGGSVLETSLSANNSISDTIIAGSTSVPMLRFDLTASCDDEVIVEDITLLHEGFGSIEDIDSVYLKSDGLRISTIKQIDPKDHTVTFGIYQKPIIIEPCETITISLMANFSVHAKANAEHNFVLELPSDVLTNSTEVAGNFPVRGNTMKITNQTNAVAEEVHVSYGKPEQNDATGKSTFMTLNIRPQSRDQVLYTVQLMQSGTLPIDVLQEFSVYSGESLLTHTQVVQGKDILITLDQPLVLKTDTSTEISITGIPSQNGSIELVIDQPEDIQCVDSMYGFGVHGQLYSSPVTLTAQ